LREKSGALCSLLVKKKRGSCTSPSGRTDVSATDRDQRVLSLDRSVGKGTRHVNVKAESSPQKKASFTSRRAIRERGSSHTTTRKPISAWYDLPLTEKKTHRAIAPDHPPKRKPVLRQLCEKKEAEKSLIGKKKSRETSPSSSGKDTAKDRLR